MWFDITQLDEEDNEAHGAREILYRMGYYETLVNVALTDLIDYVGYYPTF